MNLKESNISYDKKSDESNEHWQIQSECTLNITEYHIRAYIWFITYIIKKQVGGDNTYYGHTYIFELDSKDALLIVLILIFLRLSFKNRSNQ